MNTTAKGDAFELRMLSKVEQMIREDALPISSKHAKVFWKKSYYSEKRKGHIIVDISIECTLPREPEPSLIVIIECKDLNRPVGVEDLEEFESKVKQIAGLNVKAMMLTTSELRETAVNVAVANRMRVMKMNLDGSHTTISFRKESSGVNASTKEFANALLALTAKSGSRIRQQSIGLGPSGVYHSLRTMISDAMAQSRTIDLIQTPE